MAMVLDAFVSIFVEKLVDKAIAEIIFLLGVKREIEDLRKNLDIIKLVLVDAESKKIQNDAINRWLGELRDLMYDADDLLDDCRVQADIVAAARATSRRARIKARLRSVPGLSHLFSVGFRHEIGTRIQEMNSTLDRLKSMISTLKLLESQPKRNGCHYNHFRKMDACPIQLDDDIVGINDDATELVDQITGGKTRAHAVFATRAHAVFAITGMPGIGKTTLAKKVYSNPFVQNHFDIFIWYCVSSNFQGEDLLKEIINSVKHNYKEEERERGKNEYYVNQSELFSKVKEVVKDRRVFIVLDDVWDAHVWEEYLRVPLCKGAAYSRILITTRNEHVALKMKVVHIHPMVSMLLGNGWLMLCKIVFNEDDMHEMDELKEIGMEIVKECKGLPLAIKVVGGILKTIGRTPAAWKRVLSSRTWSLQDLPEDVQPGLLLSYEDLPSHLKQCFIYCSLFPEDFKFHQSTLVQMWIAEGFIKNAKGKEMEDLGEEYYNELVMRNVLQAVPEYYGVLGCKMHDLLRSVALFVSQNEYIYRDNENFHNSDSTKRRHLSFIEKEVEAVPKEIMEHDCIRTLFLSRNPRIKTISPEFLSKLRRLRVLDLTYTGIETLPDSLGDLIHLRFLNISFTKLRKLPDSMKNLRNLETLKANGSKYLRSLPTGLVDLCNLRHLTLGAGEKQLHNMPIGMDKLKKLRILNGFVANDGTRNGEYHYTPNMKELRDLCELTELSIYKVERVASGEEAEKATLENKMKLKYLKLSCSHRPKNNPPTNEEIENIEKVFAGIKTSKNLTIIHIEGFFGKVLPTHITSGSLCQVTWLRLDGCRFISQLPSLGDMPRLEILQIRGATSVVELSSEFVGSLKFPKLQDLYLWGMTKLERMVEVKQGAFCCLKKLHILKSPKLKSLPKGLEYAMCLRQLVIEDAESLELIQNLNSISELKIKGNSRLRSVENLPSLNIMNISECSALKCVKNVGSLNYLFISEAGMKTLPRWLKNTTAPKKLDVIGSKELVLRTYKNAEDWNLVENCSRVVTRSCDGSKYMSYGKEPYNYICDLTDMNDADSSSFTVIGSVDSSTDDEYCKLSSLPL